MPSIAGTGEKGFAGDGGPAAKAQLDQPFDVAFDRAGNLYFSDTNNYRVRKVNGRVVREYIGAGKVAELVARMDALEREQRQLEALERRHEKEQLNTLDAELKTLNDKVDLAARAALLAAGFYRHKRGEWRRRRDQDDSHSADRPEEA